MDSLDAISLVPIDYRPFTYYTPRQIARIGGCKISTPDKMMLGQYFTPGDGGAIRDWWEKDVRNTTASVVAVPMLAFGGLISSRYSGGVTTEQAQQSLQIIKRVKLQNPQYKIYAFDAILRLTTSPFRDYPGNFSGKIREWSILKDKVERMGMDHLRAEYEAVAECIPQELIEDYLYTRERNYAINKMMIDWVRDGYIDFLIIGQDDAEPYGLHRDERNKLIDHIKALGLSDKIKLFPGADVVASLLITKLIMENSAVYPKVYVEYSRKQGDQWIAPYQDIPYSQVIADYVTVLGGEMVSRVEQADLVLMANTAGTEPIDKFADRIQEYLYKGYFVTVGDDAHAGIADPSLIEALQKRIQFSDLMGYSGWNIGVSIAQSFSRWALLQTKQDSKLDLLSQSAQSHLELLLEALAHEEGYRDNVRSKAVALAKSLGDDPQRLTTHYNEINAFAIANTESYGVQWYNTHFAGKEIALGNNGTEIVFGKVDRLNGWQLYLPWNRTAEMEVFPDITIILLNRETL